MTDHSPGAAGTAAVPPTDGPPRTITPTDPAGHSVTYPPVTGSQPATERDRPSYRDPNALSRGAPTALDLDQTLDLAGLPADAAEQMYPALRPGGER